MRDILIIANFTDAPSEKGNNRFHYLAEEINKTGNVELVTSSFSHDKKMQRTVTMEQLKTASYKFTMLYEPSYKKNVSLRRLYCHYILGKNLEKYLRERKLPDVIYCAVPSLEVGKVAASYAMKNNIKFIIDIQDLWPEAFRMVFNVPLLNKLFFYPLKQKANFIYSSADEIIAVSQTYLKKVLKVNRKVKKGLSVYLGTDLSTFDNLAEKEKLTIKPNNELWLGYVGTLGHSYDIKTVLDALKLLQNKGIHNIKFIIMGDGPLKSEFEEYAYKLGVNAEFTGRLSYRKMVCILKQCDIAVNPISKGAAQSIINKHADYAAAGLPVLNTQECFEYRNLVEEYKMGFNCENRNSRDLAEKLFILYEDDILRENMGQNSRKLAEEKFNRLKTYSQILTLINKDQRT